MKLTLLSGAFVLGAVLTISAFAEEKRSEDNPGFSPQQLAERTLNRRAVEAVIWGIPAVNAELMFDAMVQAKADFNQVVYWSRPISWKNQAPTAPAGKKSNRIPTSAEGKFEVLFRFYGAEKPLFDKTWRLPDIEEVK